MKNKQLLEMHNSFFNTNATKSYKFRIKALELLEHEIVSNRREILNAIAEDLNKSYAECYTTEYIPVIREINYFKKNLKRLMKYEKTKFDLTSISSKCRIYNEPKGTVLIIAPWNYPFNLGLIPLVGSIAAGNTSILKMDQQVTRTSLIVKEILTKTFDYCYITVLDGDRYESIELTKMNFDHIFFTGSTKAGKEVMKAAADNLIPITLELGGKCPVIIDDECDLQKACDKIIWAKMLNSGQTCIAPDHVFVPKHMKEKLINGLINSLETRYQENKKVMNKNQLLHLTKMLDNALYGGSVNESNLELEFTLTDGFNEQSKDQEIFGPILPIIAYDRLEDVVPQIGTPLAIYLFTTNKNKIEYVQENTKSGSLVINNTAIYIGNNKLPFGGVKTSGIGRYHGEYSFYEFTYKRAYYKQGLLDFTSILYPPSFGKEIVSFVK